MSSSSSKKDTVEDTPSEFVNVVPPCSNSNSSKNRSPHDTTVALERLESHESALDAFFANLPQGAPHIKVQRITK